MLPLERVLGSGGVEATAGSMLDGVPVIALGRPADAAELAACLAEARAEGVAVVATCGGTKLDFGNPSTAKQLLKLDLSRLDAPLEVLPDEGIASFGAGLSIATVEHHCREAGMTTLLGSAAPEGSVGGTIAVDPVSPEASPLALLRNDLLGLEVALPNGAVTQCGGRVVKNVTGFDLVRLYCGSCGTLGLITRATLRMRPLPESIVVLSRELPDLAQAGAVMQELMRERVDPDAALIAPSESGVRLVWCLHDVYAAAEARAAQVSGDRLTQKDWERLRAEVVKPDSPPAAALRLRVAGRPSDTHALAQILAGHASQWTALPLSGNVQGVVAADALPALNAAVAAQGGIVVLEQAPLKVKERFDVFGAAPDTLPLMRALKQRFDPEGVLAPGRFLGGL